MLSMTLWLLTFLVPLQMFLGDQHGLNTAEHQPAKVAAIEARWDTQPSFPLTLFAIPDPANETVSPPDPEPPVFLSVNVWDAVWPGATVP